MSCFCLVSSSVKMAFGYPAYHRAVYKWITQFDEDWASIPADVQQWFLSEDATSTHEWFFRLKDSEQRRVDNLVGRMVGRHPSDIHPMNVHLCYAVWREKWNLSQLWADDGDAALWPATPARVE